MSTRRPGTCAEPGPYATHCTEPRLHRHSCYDAGDDSSWNERSPEDWQTDTPHDCGDPECPDNPKPEQISDRAAEAILGLVDTDRQLRGDRQTWEKPVVPGTDPRRDPVAMRLLLEVDGDGKARIHEALLVQLLDAAGWERTA